MTAHSRVMILSGAGLSAQSGLKTFRGDDGLWEGHDLMEVCSLQGWQNDPGRVTRFYNARREELSHVHPNAAHLALAGLERCFGDRIIHFTQNIDDLMERAGAERVVHLHGRLRQLRCEACVHNWDAGYAPVDDVVRCPACGSRRVRHDVVMFGEPAPLYSHLYPSLHEAGLFIAIGTSGRVIDIVDLARNARRSLLIDPVRREHVTSFGNFGENVDAFFDDFMQKRAVEAAPELIKTVEEHLKS